MAPTTLLIDWAGTITLPLRDVMINAAIAVGISEEDMHRAFGTMASYVAGEPSPLLDSERGLISDDELREWLNAQAPRAGDIFDPDCPHALFHAPDRPAVTAFMAEVRRADIQVIVATNNWVSAQPLLEQRYLATGLADGIVNSSLIGAAKPDREFYVRLADQTGVDLTTAVLFDDFDHNLEAAREFGITGVLMNSDEPASLARVRTVLGLPVDSVV